MFWYNKTLVEFDLIQHQISFAWSSDAGLSFIFRHHLSWQSKSDVGVGLIKYLFNVRTMLIADQQYCFVACAGKF